MVQKQAANSIRSQGDGFADDDPLAELARIVGFDQPLKREPVVSLPQVPDMGSAEFNLEDELMREFEGYEASPAPSVYAPPLSAPEPVVARPAPALVESVPATHYREEPRFEPEPTVSYSAPQAAYEPEPVEYPEPVSYVEDPYVSDMDLSVADDPELGRVDEAPVEARIEPEIALDLADELEFAVADADVHPVEHMAPQQPTQAETPRLRLPLANFSAQPVRRPEPQLAVEPPRETSAFDLPDFDAPTAPSISVAQEPVALDFGKASFDWASGPVEPIPASAPIAERIEPVVAPAVSAGFDDFALEPEPRAAQPVAAPAQLQAAAAVERDNAEFSFDFLNELSIDEDVEVAPQVAEPVAQRAAPVVAEEEFDPFQDQEFDLQLDDIELDLSELDVAPQKPAPQPAPVVSSAAFAAAAAPAVAPARVEPAVTTAPSYAAAPSVPAYVAAPTVSASAFAAAVARPAVENQVPTPVQASAPVRPATPVDDSFAFDPSEISEQDDLLETLSGMDVPDVPVADARPAPATQPDYDIDIDAELATLFEEPVAPAARQPNAASVSRVAAAVAPATAVGARAPAAPLDDFDAFEKALEEDFRTSMTSSGALEPESRGHITISGEGQGFRFRNIKPYLMAGTAVIVLLAGAGGLYAWLGSGAVGTLTGGEPQVIAADKSPVKIVPDDPGGKSVPNQDKAVYDRVAGNGVEDPKQPSLISSEEQPVDVVQRTLIPETLPMDGGSEALATPVGETEDPRLLPDGQSPQAAAEDPATITPRKVRTMIVRPDGTLVAQEVPVESAPAPVQTASAPSSQPAADAPVLAPPSVPNSNAGDTVRTVDTRLVTPDGATDASATAPAATATAAAELAAATPVAAETVSAPTDATTSRAPVPTTRPADQPVNVVGTVTEQGNLRTSAPAATAPAQPAAQAEVAAASPAAATPAPASTAPAGSFGVQIASLPSEADAQKSYRSLSSKFGNVLGGKPWEIRQADIPGKGTFYRVRIVAGSKDEAVALCEQYRAAGGSCLVSR
ncbi:sporulation domain-containing protein [Agrobacterium albertimagni AOL15]|uniref:Sporulation domain-containing protein n=1 Tax=Agrobacterium albertimagni AOL15 TaxID=1156935 RepID=K2Q8M4_9HYPH|nr:SPOR domain-containing protein [Agrobacterium albertimagni]EKF57256.1 sporulation domain-containing protein [Agrobacterium albertimagni AOL15]